MLRQLTLLCLGLLLACSDSSDNSGTGTIAPQYDFTAASQWLQGLVSDQGLEGAGFIVISREHGVLHTESFGAFDNDTNYLLASVSKVPSVSLLLALASDPDVNFDIDTPIENYLPWQGVYPGISTAQLLSNTSGIPGLLASFSGSYGAHMCQYSSAGEFPNAESLHDCARVIYQTPLEGTVPPGTAFDYGGSQWHLAGAVAESVGGDSWNNLFRQYIGEPCGLEVFEYANGNTGTFTGNPDSLLGRDNPNIEGGGMANLPDVAALLRMHLNDGLCDGGRVMDEELARRMRVDVGTELGSRNWVGSRNRGYGMGWWIPALAPEEATLFQDGGAFGSATWIDTARGYGVFVALAIYNDLGAATTSRNRVTDELTPIMEAIVDNPL